MTRNYSRRRRLTIACICCLTVFCGIKRAAAQIDLSGQIVNFSSWDNALLTPPGDGSGAGVLRVGLWGTEADISGVPLTGIVVSVTHALPFADNSRHEYTISSLATGDYQLVAWIDGNADAGLDVGEPRSHAVGITIGTNDVTLADMEIVDDIDGDGMADWWEAHWFGDLETADATSDFDNDGLTDFEEFEIAMSHPSLITLDPTNWDSSGDGMDDWWKWQYYAGGAGLHPCLFEAHADFDGDGLTNLQEYRGVDGIPRMEQDPDAAPGVGRLTGSDNWLNPLDIDTSGDGLIDSFVLAWYDPANGIDPLAAGDPGGDPDGDGLTTFREQCLHGPLRQGGVNDIWSHGPDRLPQRNPVTGIRAFVPALDLGVAGIEGLQALVYALRANADWTKPSNGSGYDFDHLAGTKWHIERRPGWDTDGDGLPDGWEVEFGLDPRDGAMYILDPTGSLVVNPNGMLGDPDGDGLMNIQEFHGQDGQRGSGDETNPHRHAWWPNIVEPREHRFDSVMNFAAVNFQHAGGMLAGALPSIATGWSHGYDTAGNGISDGEEVSGGSSPVHSMDPFVMRSARIISDDGIVMPDPVGSPQAGYRPDLITRAWSLEGHVKLSASGRSGDLIYLPGPLDLQDETVQFTARLSLSNDVPLIAFQTVGGKTYQVTGLALPVGQWVHLAGVWDPDNNALTLFVDGIFKQSIHVFEECVSFFHYAMRDAPRLAVSGGGAGGFNGNALIDEVRVWGVARTAEQIESYRRDLVHPAHAGDALRAYFRFDDGGSAAEDFMRRARSSLLGGGEYAFADYGYALPSGAGFEFETNNAAVIYGIDRYGADDVSGDGMPDPWKLVNHLDVFSSTGADGPQGDPDGDGLWNIYEYWARTNPRKSDTSGNGIPDTHEDFDGDGIANIVEQQYGTRPDMVDTDNNGFTDAEEIAMGTDPINPLDPLISRCMRFGGGAGDYLEAPIQAKQRLATWTLEAWVKPEAGTGGTVIRRTVQRVADDLFAANWLLAVAPAGDGSLIAYAGFVTPGGGEHYVSSTPFAAGAWTHLAASYNAADLSLKLYTNGLAVAATNIISATPPVNGKGGESFTRIGESFAGAIDEVRVWDSVRSAADLRANHDRRLDIGTANLVHHFRFDDGQANENQVPFGEFHQPYGPQDFTHPEDWHNQWRHAAVMHGNVAFAAPGAIPAAPSLRVVIEPGNAVAAGAQWRVDGGPWRDGGTLIEDMEQRLYEIEFTAHPPWVAPASIQVELTTLGMTTVTGVFEHISGARILIQPVEAVSAGAAWRFAGETNWYASGQYGRINPGTHEIEFRDIEGWSTPAPFAITVNEETVMYYTRIYYLKDTLGAGGSDLPGQFRFPRGLALDAARNLYVADSGNHRVQVYNPFEAVWTILGSRGSEAGEFEQPFGVTVDTEGRVYIADANNHRIQRFDPVAGVWTVWGGPQKGSAPGLFNAPYDVAVDAGNHVYVADYYNHRVQKRAGDGSWTVLIANGHDHETQTRLPSGLAIQGQSLVLADYDMENLVSRVRRFDLNGGYLETLPADAAGIPLDKPRSPFAASADNLLLADMVNNRILRFDPDARVWDILMAKPTLNEPEGVALDVPGFIYISDTANHRVLRLGMSGLHGREMTPFTKAIPRRTRAAGDPAGLTIRWHGKNEWIYVVQYRDCLSDETGWKELPGGERVIGRGDELQIVDPEVSELKSRFYRVLAY